MTCSGGEGGYSNQIIYMLEYVTSVVLLITRKNIPGPLSLFSIGVEGQI